MRIWAITAVLALLVGSAAVAQSAPQADVQIPSGGPVPDVYPGPGRDEVGPDGVSTKVVKAAPCSAAAQETDGATTCIGIPGPVPRDGDTADTPRR
jgi:hypothetical protein